MHDGSRPSCTRPGRPTANHHPVLHPMQVDVTGCICKRTVAGPHPLRVMLLSYQDTPKDAWSEKAYASIYCQRSTIHLETTYGFRTSNSRYPCFMILLGNHFLCPPFLLCLSRLSLFSSLCDLPFSHTLRDVRFLPVAFDIPLPTCPSPLFLSPYYHHRQPEH